MPPSTPLRRRPRLRPHRPLPAATRRARPPTLAPALTAALTAALAATLASASRPAAAALQHAAALTLKEGWASV